MDIILDVNGKYTILFNGSVIPCADDAECPFHSICFVGLDFMSSDQCGCASEVALVGLQCDEPSPLSMGYTAISVICWYIFDFVTMYTNAQNELQLTFSTACIICFTMFMTALVLLFRIYQNGLIKKLQVLSTSIFLSFVASLSLFVVNVYLVMFSTLPLDKNEVSGSSNLGQASTSISFFFVSISVLNLALLWIRVAKMGSQRPHRFPYGPLLFVCAYYLVFGTLILVFAILGQAIYSLYVAAPALFLATICYLVAVYRLNIVCFSILLNLRKTTNKIAIAHRWFVSSTSRSNKVRLIRRRRHEDSCATSLLLLVARQLF
jgi:uncharacterized membrane protein YidH (DUF202 family)